MLLFPLNFSSRLNYYSMPSSNISQTESNTIKTMSAFFAPYKISSQILLQWLSASRLPNGAVHGVENSIPARERSRSLLQSGVPAVIPRQAGIMESSGTPMQEIKGTVEKVMRLAPFTLSLFKWTPRSF